MTVTIASIAAEAFDGIAADISGVVAACTLTAPASGAYDSATDSYGTAGTAYAGRAVIVTETPVADVFPAYVAGPHDVLVLIEGLTVPPAEGWEIVMGATTRHLTAVLDIAGAGSLFYAVAR